MECNINWIYCIRAEENSGPANQNILSRNHSLLFRSLNTAKSLPLYLCFYLLIRFMLVLSLSLSHFLFFISWMILVKSTLVSKKLLKKFRSFFLLLKKPYNKIWLNSYIALIQKQLIFEFISILIYLVAKNPPNSLSYNSKRQFHSRQKHKK